MLSCLFPEITTGTIKNHSSLCPMQAGAHKSVQNKLHGVNLARMEREGRMGQSCSSKDQGEKEEIRDRCAEKE